MIFWFLGSQTFGIVSWCYSKFGLKLPTLQSPQKYVENIYMYIYFESHLLVVWFHQFGVGPGFQIFTNISPITKWCCDHTLRKNNSKIFLYWWILRKGRGMEAMTKKGECRAENMARNPSNVSLKLIHRHNSTFNVPAPTVKTRGWVEIHPSNYLCPEDPKMKFDSGDQKGITDECGLESHLQVRL